MLHAAADDECDGLHAMRPMDDDEAGIGYASMKLGGGKRWRAAALAGAVLGTLLIGIRLWPHPPLSARVPGSSAIHDANGRLLRLVLSSDDKFRLWLPLAQISPQLIEAVQLQEDQWFRWHPGFNPVSLLRGAYETYITRGPRQGGSTLTMQLARLRYRLNTRTPGGKLLQMALAIQLELCYSKDAILEAYLNLAPYGGNIEGAGAASLIYFDKPVSRLTLPEALALAVLPQDPSRRLRSTLATDGTEASNRVLGDSLVAARARLYQRWRAIHGGDDGQDALMRLPLSLRAPSALPYAAPHAVDQVLLAARRQGELPARLDTTLDLRLQRTLERQLEGFLQGQRERGIDNAAALLVDARDMAVKALVGSADYFDATIDGQVNGTDAKRSPGSTLKPFVYALGMDQGVLHPRTVLRDVPTAFGPFSPENFDGRFLGPVTATDALIRSRNIPAVQVAARLASPNLYGFLKAAGIGRMASERHYGLALVLGGGEVTMQELARLYAMLANRGVMRPLRFRADAPAAAGVRLLSDEASFMVMDMLRQNPRPDEGVLGQEALVGSRRLPVYWKTGTSWAFRDAWTAGVFGPYVLVVWSGHFDGSGNPALIGVEAAAPLFFRIVDAIAAQDRQLAEPAWTLPAGVKRVEVCLASGDLPNADCPQRGSTWFIPGKSPIRVSSVHRAVIVDTRTGKAACPPFDPQHSRRDVFEYWPSDLAQVFAQAGMPRRKPPVAAPGCANGLAHPALVASPGCAGMAPGCDAVAAGDGDPPRIDSPLRAVTYTLRRSQPERARIALSASVDAGVRRLYWFVDDAYIGHAAPGEILFWQAPRTGAHNLRAVDDHGRAAERGVRVEVVD